MRKLLQHLKTDWYRYALETLVVIVGILVAFTLNNWNENRKNRIKEKQLLMEIRDNIQHNIDLIQDDLDGWDKVTIRSLNIMIDFVEGKIPYSDTLSFNDMHRVTDPAVSNASYEALKSTGFDILLNHDLRSEIIGLFDVTYPGMVNQINELELSWIKPTAREFVTVNFTSSPKGGKLIPNDWRALKENPLFLNILTQNRNWINYFTYMKQQTIAESERVLALVELEIKK